MIKSVQMELQSGKRFFIVKLIKITIYMFYERKSVISLKVLFEKMTYAENLCWK